MQLIADIFDLFWAQFWRLETSSRVFYDSNEMGISLDILLYICWYLQLSLAQNSHFQNSKKQKHIILGYWKIPLGLLNLKGPGT